MPKTKKVAKSLSSKINKLMYKRGDICCTEDIDRETAITFLLNKYENDLASLANDIPILLGYKVNMDKNNDKLGSKLWELMDNRLYKNDEPNLNNIIKLLNDVPLYYLLALIGKITLNKRDD
jgi:hypothetical protein